ncbi:MAG: efflux RND transporter periplasmic adaptor subunit [Burkholderiales bacterium]
MTKRMIIMLVSLGVLFGGIFGFQAFKAHMIKKYMSANMAPPVTVTTIKAEETPWQPEMKSVGSLRAVKGVDVTTEIAGQVRVVSFKSGQDVKAGDLLVQLDADPDVAKLHSLEAARDLAKIVYNRDKAQFDAQAISRAQLDADDSDLKNKQAQVDEQRAQVAEKTIRAPFSGRIGITTVQPGQYLNPGDKIATLQQVDPIYADFSIPEQQIPGLVVGQKIAIEATAYPGQTFSGRINAIDPKVDPATRNVMVEATIPNSKRQLLPGMYASVAVDAGEVRRYLTLPQTAVAFNPYGATVYVVEESHGPGGKSVLVAKQRFVSTGSMRGDQVAILSGVKAGDIVVTSGQIKLKSGSHVIVNNKVVPSNDAAPKPVDE